MSLRIIRFCAAVSVMLGSPAAAQTGGSLGAGAYLEVYNFADPAAGGLKRVALLTVPIAAEFRMTSWARLGVSSAYASGTVTRADDSESEISGIADTALQLTLPLVQDRFTLAATLLVPTGKSTYTPDEAQVAGIIAADLLPFRLTNWGSGGALDVSTQVTAPLNGLNVGARVGYQVGQEFDLVEDGSFSYRPGNQLYVRVAADGSVGDGRLAAQVSVYTFGDDQLNSQNLYRSGRRIQGILSHSARAGRTGRLQTYAGLLRRQHGTFVDGSEETPAQTLFFLGTGLRRPVGRAIIVPSVDVRFLRSSDGESQGFIGGAGASLEIPIANGRVTLLPTGRARFGRLLVSEGLESGITGFDVGAGIRFGGGRQ